jgi:hypothetical protein
MSDIRTADFWKSLLNTLLRIVGNNLAPKKRSERHQHVVPHDDGWAVRGEGNKRITSKHRKQETAIRKAQILARRYKSDVIIHGRDGRIRDRMSYD